MTRRLTGRSLVVSTCLLATFGAGCASGSTPSPTPSATSATAVATPSETAQEHEERLAYEAAEKSYRTFRGEYERLTRSGGTDKPSGVILATSGGSYQSELMKALRAFKTAGFRTEGTEKIPTITRLGYSPQAVSLKACEDDRAVHTVDRSGSVVDKGDVLVVQVEVRHTGSAWKVWSGSGEGASSCDGF